MRIMLLLASAVACVSQGAQAAEKAPCAAKPFTLAKPAPPPPKAAAQPVKKPAPAQATAKAGKPLADCKKKAAGG